ncbi:urea ABC transporter permease subunit UrtB [Synechococcus sp. CS-1325]|uniref:urea ABC transporter permease subunit UrtB n=1 Tax=unclassified Synechococcus TaxID=2626047 RepID=UPI000DB4DAF1|nr:MULTISPECIES: urea ABC transporter permease subunit UrtB [unclassified Synechococcus]PZV02274.1 MAG: urea ABC transporter permease subunit UrtB [Cyanobium sp.]MCT0198916.1 urea ABC transporter permease subunit UrtB [Synechococcus sp. CS-1325]MCT0214565.1 urea ABC transporter permease subunit UrtB [Synechococcus sp. CS-1326]MCT0230883.1 urea ABC transporter permease subunit UrtB [Synechococcus sp. CS-1324]MCT0233899.1 urea ABC transporter permease subunit UrtB [Synechococcus sp. CS-1327]
MDLLYETLFNGLAIGSVLVLAALGLAVVFGLMGVINMAHGELMMLGAYTTYVVQNLCKEGPLEALFPIYILVAIPLAFLVSGLAGLLLEKTVIRRLYGRPLETLLATWGVSLILQQFVRSVSSAFMVGLVLAVAIGLLLPRFTPRRWWEQRWTPIIGVSSWLVAGLVGILAASALGTNRSMDQPWFSARNLDVSAPDWLQGAVDVGGVTMPTARLFIIALSLVALLAVNWFLQKSVWGIRIRAVTQNRSMSDCLGIPTQTVDALTFLVGSGLAGVAGVAVTLLGSVGPNLGGNYIVDCFMVVVLGGVGKLLGTVVAALSIGVLSYVIGSGSLLLVWPTMPAGMNEVITFFATTSMAKVLVFILIVVFLQFKPAGLFPPKGRMVEA